MSQMYDTFLYPTSKRFFSSFFPNLSFNRTVQIYPVGRVRGCCVSKEDVQLNHISASNIEHVLQRLQAKFREITNSTTTVFNSSPNKREKEYTINDNDTR